MTLLMPNRDVNVEVLKRRVKPPFFSWLVVHVVKGVSGVVGAAGRPVLMAAKCVWRSLSRLFEGSVSRLVYP